MSIVITGVSRGIGRALAEEFLRLGHDVAGCARSAEPLVELATAAGKRGMFSPVDVADAAAVERWARDVLAWKGAPTLLVNNAGLLYPETPLWEIPPADFDRILQVNVAGTAHVLRAFTPSMISKGRGVLVNFSSGWGRGVDAGFSLYCATKWAVEGLTKALALELPEGLAAIALSPGMVNTFMLEQAFPGHAHRSISPAEWARGAAPWLLGLGPKENGQSLTFSR